MVEYIPTKIYIKDGNLYLNTNKGTFKINVPENISVNDELAHKYKAVSPLHVINENGEFGLYQHQSFRPFFGVFPPELRKAEQWEFDKYCFENPDERYVGQSGYVDVNALVWETWTEEYNFS